MKKLFIILTTIVVPLFIFVNRADAHFLATDGNIGAVLHVDPNDDPIAGSQASFFFEFKDKQNQFTPQQCDCTFEIVENGNTIFSQPLFQNNSNPDLSNASVFYTFPQRDVYQVVVIGKPTSTNAFQPFTLTWNFRVDQQASTQTATGQHTDNFFTTHLVNFIVLGLLIVGFLAYIISNSRKSKKQTRPTAASPSPKWLRRPSKAMVGKEGGVKKDDEKTDNNMY